MEDIMHLFFSCRFSQGLWWSISMEWNYDENVHGMIIDASINHWLLDTWNQRNGMIFENVQCSIDACKMDFRNIFHMTMIRDKPSIREGMLSLTDNV
jgi:hypothetical protein